MNYLNIYDRLIKNAMGRKPLEVFVERHHILPKCLGGSNATDNLVDLTPKEHRLAHKLLCKIYAGDVRLIYAANMMYMGRPGDSPDYLRRKVSESRRKAWSNPIDREKIISGIRRSWTKTRRANRSEDRSRYWSNEDNRKSNSEKLKAYWLNNKVISDEKLLELRDLRSTGLGWRRLSKATGFATTTLRRYLA